MKKKKKRKAPKRPYTKKKRLDARTKGWIKRSLRSRPVAEVAKIYGVPYATVAYYANL